MRVAKRAVTVDTLAAAPEMLEELYRVLNERFDWPAIRISAQLDRLFKDALSVSLKHKVHVCRDPKDNMFLECAALAHADVLVTGDKDLLSLGGFLETRILTPSEYLEFP